MADEQFIRKNCKSRVFPVQRSVHTRIVSSRRKLPHKIESLTPNSGQLTEVDFLAIPSNSTRATIQQAAGSSKCASKLPSNTYVWYCKRPVCGTRNFESNFCHLCNEPRGSDDDNDDAEIAADEETHHAVDIRQNSSLDEFNTQMQVPVEERDHGNDNLQNMQKLPVDTHEAYSEERTECATNPELYQFRIFAIFGFTQDRSIQLEEHIRKYGGLVADIGSIAVEEADYSVVSLNTRNITAAHRKAKEIVNDLWVWDSYVKPFHGIHMSISKYLHSEHIDRIDYCKRELIKTFNCRQRLIIPNIYVYTVLKY